MINPTRRFILAGALSSAALPLVDGRSAYAAHSMRAAILLIRGVGARTDPSTFTALNRLLDNGIPLAIAIDPFNADGSTIAADDRLSSALRDLVDRHGRLIETCVTLDAVPTGSPLAQLRQASAAQTALVGLLNPGSGPSPRPTAMAATAVTATRPMSDEDFRAMRAAGIRTTIHLGAHDPADGSTIGPQRYWTTSTGLANFIASSIGHVIVDERGEFNFETIRYVLDEGDDTGPVVLSVDAGGLSSPEGLQNVGVLGGILRGAADNAVIQPLLPTVHYAQNHPDDVRRIVLRFDGVTPDAGALASLLPTPLLAALTPAIAEETAGNLVGRYADLALLGWAHENPDEDAVRDEVAEAARLAFQTAGIYPSTFVPNDPRNVALLTATANAGILSVSAPIGARDTVRGLDAFGVLHLPDTVAFALRADDAQLLVPEVLSQLSSNNDAVLAIDPETVATDDGLRGLQTVLSAISGQRGTRIGGFRDYSDAVAPDLAWLRKVQHAKAEVRVLDAGDGDLGDRERDRLMDDARLAWTFFEWGATRYKGMVAGTASRQNGVNQVGWPYATQWDIASYVNATLSARFLGLIDLPAFDTIVTDTLALLPRAVFNFAGARLPNTEIGLGGNVSTSRGYDSHDAGRLLIALGNLESYTPGRFPIAEIVADWNLDAGIVDGLIHSIAGNGTFIPGHTNSYAHYIRNGFTRWGYDPLPVYPDFPDGIEGEVAFIAEVARRGRIATEALLTEEVEVGGTDQIRLAADVLLAAQIERHRETGILTCTSEGPLDFPPYFSYQGYQILENGGEFVVDGRSNDQQTLLRSMGSRARMVSTKGAFLWYAARPGTYSTALYEHTRSVARIEGLGFSSGIHEGTDEALEVSDVNTNGLILEAIAYIFNGRKPLSDLNRQT